MTQNFFSEFKNKYLTILIIFIIFSHVKGFSNSSECCGEPITKYVVATDGSGGFSSIQSAIDAAVIGGGHATVWIKNGSYFEDLILYDGINLVGASGLGDLGDVEVTGTHIPPIMGHIILRNIRWNSENYVLYSEDHGSSHIVFMDALFNIKDGYACYLPYWDGTQGGVLEFYDINPGLPDYCNDGAVFNPHGGVQVFLYNAGLGMGRKNKMIVSGQMIMQGAATRCPLHFNSGAVLTCDASLIEEGVSFSGSSTAEISNSRITSSLNPTIAMNSLYDVNLYGCVLDGVNKPSISGSGDGNLNIIGSSFPRGVDIEATVNQYNVGIVKVGALEISSKKLQILGGEGPPTMIAAKGSLYLRSDGSSSITRMYVNIDGAYIWTPVVTED